MLAQYTTAAPEGGKAGPVTLYLISPGGARYQLARWPDSRTAPGLVAWSPDGKRALFQVFSGKERAEQLTLATGRKSTFVMQGNATPIGYTTPRGLNIVGTRPSGTGSIRGPVQPVRPAATVARLRRRAVQPVRHRVRRGRQPRHQAGQQPRLADQAAPRAQDDLLPGSLVGRRHGAGVLRAAGQLHRQLWLVPVSGARPKALTRPRNPARSGDFGDLDAWRLPSGLYLQAAGACGVLHIYRQARNGSIKLVIRCRTPAATTGC